MRALDHPKDSFIGDNRKKSVTGLLDPLNIRPTNIKNGQHTARF